MDVPSGNRRFALWAAVLAGFGLGANLRAAALSVQVEVDEVITSTPLPGNGTTPLWAYGAPMLVRHGDTVWASIAITDPEARPYCNTHWELWRRDDFSGTWERVQAGPAAAEREPCPIALVDDETIVVSAHPRVLGRGADSSGNLRWFCQPVLATFRLRDPDDDDAMGMLAPVFNPGATFRQHSYRGLGVDRAARELLLLMIEDDDYQPTWRDAGGRWHPLPVLHFPIRACYPQVALRDRAAHVLAIGDIIEPNRAWLEEKRRVPQREWDYVFRRLFYVWTPQVAEGFGEPVEIDSVEEMAGWMFNADLWLDASGRAHILYFKRTIQYAFLRDRFFPGQAMTDTLVHAVIDRGRLAARETLHTQSAEPADADEPSRQRPWICARFHELADGRLVAVYALDDPAGAGSGGLFIRQLDMEAGASHPPVRVPLAQPGDFARRPFFTNTARGGSDPGNRLDLFGANVEGDRMSLRYVSLEID